MVPELVTAWAAGWAVSRGTHPPTAHPWGCVITVGLPEQSERRVVYVPEADAVRAACADPVPYAWLKAAEDPDVIRRLLPRGWVVDEEDTGHLMAVDLAPPAGPSTAPPGYVASVNEADGVLHVRVTDAAGGPAAKGQLVVVGDVAVVDRVVTEEAHRRRGLGRLVMRTLGEHALAAGAFTGVLGATDDGRALYETLGWKRHTALTACAYRP
ncbi:MULTISPECIES: GNAT family N-acetyltransferase [Streptomyces]|uniref:GNAT family N-acetyltransferase n=1 Tax=Streptomyces TaxID=1883 RepID=UPI00163B9F6A|nr:MULTISPECIES: GNAT family N-acetyltransferase [Streptomyces]MBC2879149.1 GNAT family N-acetyltransferase [Streptomyces sp. TYQ1024]UBI35350.1 GNAT family N-acetyltransferase [Streptomyces mobaraensis]UKW27941.1 GNAT family N-acetyltransferase [Streptomyces sp. TYQ1024]